MFVLLLFASNVVLCPNSIIMQRNGGAINNSPHALDPEAGRIYNNIRLQVPFSRRCCSSRHGRFATVDVEQRLPVVVLRNPFTKAKPIFLPPLKTIISHDDPLYHEHYVRNKVILSADPTMNPKNYVVVALYGCGFMLAFIKASQNNWTYPIRTGEFDDVIFYKSKVYALETFGEIESLDVFSSDSPWLKLCTPYKPFTSCKFLHAYLVESTKGDLLHILRFYASSDGRFRYDARRQTTHFVVYKCVYEDGGSIGHKFEVKSIGDEALFVGGNHSISVLASKFPRCQPNSIYYTDDYFSN